MEITMIEGLFSVLGSAASVDTDSYNKFCDDIFGIYKIEIPWTIYEIFLIIDRNLPKRFCDMLKDRCHHYKLHLKKKHLYSASDMELIEDSLKISPFDIINKSMLENRSFGRLSKGPLKERLEKIDKKCKEKERREKIKKSTVNSLAQTLSLSHKKKMLAHSKKDTPTTTDDYYLSAEDLQKAAEVQRIINLVYKMAQRRGERLSIYNRLTTFPHFFSLPQTKKPGSPKRKRESDDKINTIKSFKERKLQKKSPFVLPSSYERLTY